MPHFLLIIRVGFVNIDFSSARFQHFAAASYGHVEENDAVGGRRVCFKALRPRLEFRALVSRKFRCLVQVGLHVTVAHDGFPVFQVARDRIAELHSIESVKRGYCFRRQRVFGTEFAGEVASDEFAVARFVSWERIERGANAARAQFSQQQFALRVLAARVKPLENNEFAFPVLFQAFFLFLFHAARLKFRLPAART